MLDPVEEIMEKIILDMAKEELQKGVGANIDVVAEGFRSYQKIMSDRVQRNYIYRTAHPEEFGDDKPRVNADLWFALQDLKKVVSRKKPCKRKKTRTKKVQVYRMAG